eukprot:223817-Chlamydomonas_euryale.AAC.6
MDDRVLERQGDAALRQPWHASDTSDNNCRAAARHTGVTPATRQLPHARNMSPRFAGVSPHKCDTSAKHV